ncbi:MAG: hypothetical protein RJA70_17 [Pseudomonadota bacterium]|jgi:hypothetical protein
MALRALCAASLAATVVQADDAVLVKIGARNITVSQARVDLNRLGLMPALGALTGDPLRQHIDEKYVPRLLLDTHAADRAKHDPAFRLQVAPHVDAALAQALEQSLTPLVDDAEVARFYDANVATYRRPLAIRISRILTATRAKAESILKEVRDNPQAAARFAALAREHSADSATHMRAGDLGFVQKDGHTDVPQLRVNPVLFQAVESLRDGDLVEEPLVEGKYFAAVWRRGTRAERIRTLEQEAENIRGLLLRDKRHLALNELLGQLRSQHLTEYAPTTLEVAHFPPFEGLPLTRPGATAHAAQGTPTPGSDGR